MFVNFFRDILLSLQVAPPSDPRKELEIHANVLALSSPVYKMYSKKEKHSAKTIFYANVKVSTSIELYIIARFDFLHWLAMITKIFLH